MGIAFSVVAVAMLVGTPIEGALLGHHFEWWEAIVFCGVSFTWILKGPIAHAIAFQVCVSVGTLFMIISRHLYVRRKGGRSQLV
jgi:MFS transporter, MCT family, solute carrier family 16 (monocarboxylic acid transporters), member 10